LKRSIKRYKLFTPFLKESFMATPTPKARPASKTPGPSVAARKTATAAKKAPAKKAPAKKAPTSAKKAPAPAKKAPTAPKSLATPVPAQASPAAKPPLAEKPKVDKPKKPKLVRDSFTIPKTEYAAIDALKQRAAKLGQAPKKSEVLRAGIMLLASLSDAALLTALSHVPAIKTGRPKA
jgi:hypothetical protein